MVDQVSGAGGHKGLEVPRAVEAGPARARISAGAALRPTSAGQPADAQGPPALKGLVRDLASRPPVDSARVEALRTAIGTGTYRIDPGQLADAMIATVRPGA